MTKEDAEGRLILSKKRARFEIAWKAIEGAHEQGEPVTGRVIEVVKGGLILDLGVRGFLPASLVDIRRVQDLDEYLGQELRCKVIELNRSRNNVVLSRRAVLEDERKEMRQAILDKLNPGDVVEGTISNIVDFGAFVDLDGMDGLIHISELSWSHVNHPSEVLEIGQKVNVKVLDIDRERQRISLGLKQTQTDPWQQVLESYQEGDVVQGKVTKVVTFGAFVEILPGVEGLVHISELAQHHVENPREVVSQGDTVNVRILEVDAERRRLSLSLKRVEDGMPVQPKPGDEAAPPADRPLRGRLRGRRGGASARARGRADRYRGRACRRRGRADRSRGRAGRSRFRRAASRGIVARRPLAVAVTGGIAAGKSEALAAFARHGAATLSSRQARARAARARRGGAGGDPRPLGRRRAVGRPRAHRRDRLPRPRRARVARAAAPPERPVPPPTRGVATVDAPLAVIEVPLLYETGGETRFDAVVVITAPPEVRAGRRAGIADREARLVPDAEKVRRADFSFVNDGSLDRLEAFVAEVTEALCAR